MTVKLSDVSGLNNNKEMMQVLTAVLLLPEFTSGKYNTFYKRISDVLDKYHSSSDQGAVEIGLNRERLAGKCYELRCKINGGKTFVSWDVVVQDKSHPVYFVCLEDADAIISDLKELIEVKK